MSTIDAEHIIKAPRETVLPWVPHIMRSLTPPSCSIPGSARYYCLEQRSAEIWISEYDIPALYMTRPTRPSDEQSQRMQSFRLISFLPDQQGRGTVTIEHSVHWLEQLVESSKSRLNSQRGQLRSRRSQLEVAEESEELKWAWQELREDERELKQAQDELDRLMNFLAEVRSYRAELVQRLHSRLSRSVTPDQESTSAEIGPKAGTFDRVQEETAQRR